MSAFFQNTRPRSPNKAKKGKLMDYVFKCLLGKERIGRNKESNECGNYFKCNFIPKWLSRNPNAL